MTWLKKLAGAGTAALMAVTGVWAQEYSVNGKLEPKGKDEVRVFMDGVFDLAHGGHKYSMGKALKVIRDLPENKDKKVSLIVGVCSDEECTPYKRPPIFNADQRVERVHSFQVAPVIVKNSPMSLTDGFLDDLEVDYVVHGDDYSQEQAEKCYGVAIKKGRYRTFPYTDGISTSQILAEVVKLVKRGQIDLSKSDEEIEAQLTGYLKDENYLVALKLESFPLKSVIKRIVDIFDSGHLNLKQGLLPPDIRP